jgi:5-methylcytosine-specific restriction protein A
MRNFGRSGTMPANEGNQNKKLRIETNLDEAEIIRTLRAVPAPANRAPVAGIEGLPVGRLPAAELRRVEPRHIRVALARLDSGEPASNFDPSRDYDVMTGDGRKYAPEQVFGFAIEAALGIVARPSHFSAGWNTTCFDILEECGLWIVPKQGAAQRNARVGLNSSVTQPPIPTEEERTWIEGNPKIAQHMTRERQPGLAAMKRAQFVRDHGKLICERCKLDPLDVYGPDAGSACIEVHHHRTHVAAMLPCHETSLDDLKCLCSNCHRVLHRALSIGLPFDV